MPSDETAISVRNQTKSYRLFEYPGKCSCDAALLA